MKSYNSSGPLKVSISSCIWMSFIYISILHFNKCIHANIDFHIFSYGSRKCEDTFYILRNPLWLYCKILHDKLEVLFCSRFQRFHFITGKHRVIFAVGFFNRNWNWFWTRLFIRIIFTRFHFPIIFFLTWNNANQNRTLKMGNSFL